MSRKRAIGFPPFVSSATATPASGTTRRNAACPIVPPSCPRTVRPLQPKIDQPRPQWRDESPSPPLGTSICGTCIARTDSAETTCTSSTVPPVRWSRANCTTSAAVEQIPPGAPAVRAAPTRTPCAAPGREARRDPSLRGSADVLGQGRRVRQLHRLEQARADRRVPDLPRRHLDHPAEQREPGVAIRHRRPERMHLTERRARQDVLLERVVTAAGVGEMIAVDAARMREQVPDRDRLGDALVGHLELGR